MYQVVQGQELRRKIKPQRSRGYGEERGEGWELVTSVIEWTGKVSVRKPQERERVVEKSG